MSQHSESMTLSHPWSSLQPRFVFITLIMIITSLLLGVIPVSAQADADFNAVYERVSPSVVSISVIARRANEGFTDADQTVVGGGTGFVLDNDGHIMTNNHVVEGAIEIEISFFDGTLAAAEVVGLDPDSDLAVLDADLPAEDLEVLQPITFGDSDQLEVGQTVLAIGSPFGKRWTLTSGIISATDRSIPGLDSFSIGGVIQTDAAINPGNSGGPLIDLNGNVIGVNSQIISGGGSSAGVGFAVPSNLAARVAPILISEGSIDYSYLGVGGNDVYLPLIRAFDIPNDTQGLVVFNATEGGPAHQAGIEAAVFSQTDENNPRAVPQSVDIITAVNGEPISGISELIGYLAAETEPGQTVTLDVLRLGQGEPTHVQIDVTLTARPDAQS